MAAIGWVSCRLAAEKALGKHLPEKGQGCLWGDGAETKGIPQSEMQAEGRAQSLPDLLASAHPQDRGHRGSVGGGGSRAPRETLSLLCRFLVSLDLMSPHPSLSFQ